MIIIKKIGFLNLVFTLIIFCFNNSIQSQTEQDFYTIIDDVSSKRIEQDITTLSNFGTRHTLSDTGGLEQLEDGFLIAFKG